METAPLSGTRDVDFQKVHKYVAKRGYDFNIYFVSRPRRIASWHDIMNYAGPPQGVDAHYRSGTYHVN